MSSTERSIPHLRDIFGINNYTSHHHTTQNNNIYGLDNYGQSNHQYQYQQQQLQSPVSPPIIAQPTTGGGDLLKTKQSRKKRDNNKTLTSGDIKTLERHLSMKKTIRKKIMRDLQQAFVEDPNEFKVENSNTEHLRSELKAEALRFGENPLKKSDNFLVMLRGGDQKPSTNINHHNINNINNNNNNNVNNVCSYDYPNNRDYDYDSTSATVTTNGKDEKQSFWKRFTMKNKTNKR